MPGTSNRDASGTYRLDSGSAAGVTRKGDVMLHVMPDLIRHPVEKVYLNRATSDEIAFQTSSLNGQ